MSLSIPGRFNRLFQKFLSTKGGALITDVGGEIIPVFPLFFGVENRYLEGWDRFGFQAFQAGGVGVSTQFRLRNPAGSGLITVLEQVTAFSGAAGAGLADNVVLLIGAQAADLTTNIGTLSRIDARGRQSSGLIASSQSGGATFGKNISQVAYPVNGFGSFITTENQEITLAPGDAVQVGGGVFNQSLTASMIWRERALEESELK